jgi:hypothetical protein
MIGGRARLALAAPRRELHGSCRRACRPSVERRPGFRSLIFRGRLEKIASAGPEFRSADRPTQLGEADRKPVLHAAIPRTAADLSNAILPLSCLLDPAPQNTGFTL